MCELSPPRSAGASRTAVTRPGPNVWLVGVVGLVGCALPTVFFSTSFKPRRRPLETPTPVEPPRICAGDFS
jgi:hypothetical protein